MGSLFSKKNGAWYLVSGTAAFNEALELVGIDKVKSISDVLSNSDYCTALAGNAEAVEIMKANYSVDMVTAIDSKWNEGLNLLNYKCGLKTYLYHAGNECRGITGGFVYLFGASNKDSCLDISPSSGNTTAYARTTDKIDLTEYARLYTVVSYVFESFQFGLTDKSGSQWSTSYILGSIDHTTIGTKTIKVSGHTGYRYQCHSVGGCNVTDVYIVP